MRRDGSRSPRWPGSWRATWLLSLSALALMLAMPLPTVHAQEPLPQPQSGLLPGLLSTEQMTLLLTQRLTERAQQVADLQANLEQARQAAQSSAEQLTVLESQLAAAQEWLSSLQTALVETQNSLDKSRQDFEALSKSSEDYRAEAQTQLAEQAKERDAERARADRNKVLAIIGWITAAVGGGYAAGHLLAWW